MKNLVGQYHSLFLAAVIYDDDGFIPGTAILQVIDRKDLEYLFEGYNVPPDYVEAMDRGANFSIDPAGRSSGMMLVRRYTQEEIEQDQSGRQPIDPDRLPMLPLDGDKAAFRPLLLNDDYLGRN